MEDFLLQENPHTHKRGVVSETSTTPVYTILYHPSVMYLEFNIIIQRLGSHCRIVPARPNR